MKVKSCISKRCLYCRIIRRNKHLYIYCNKSKRHKQKQK
uniref:Ribosomal protein n=1 Tax=Hepatozoon canis TaxID=110120 RepID=A0A3S8TEJ5_9APIC|nr:ribosomal protein L36 [Hepatozoon canis]